MADNVDISLKLGTEADLSSAISAGARAGAAFAAAAQNAVSGIQLNAGATMRAFSTGAKKISSGSDLAKEARSLGIAQIASQRILREAEYANKKTPRLRISSKPNDSFWPNDNAPAGYSVPTPLSGFSSKYIGTQYSGDPIEKSVDFLENMNKSIAAIEAINKKQEKEGLWVKIKRVGDKETWQNAWGARYAGIGYGKVAQMLLQPAMDWYVESNAAEYRAQIARNAGGFRREELEKKNAVTKMASTYTQMGSSIIGSILGAVIGGIIAPGVGAVPGAMIGGAIGGGAGTVAGGAFQDTINKREAELQKQERTLNESQKRYLNANLFGYNYNTSYQEAIGGMGIGITEDSIRSMAGNALTFRGRQAFGQVGLHEYTMLAQVPNYFAALNNGITDPETLQKLLRHDLENIGDPSMAAYIATQLMPGGLNDWGGLKSDAYALATNSVNSRVLRGENRRANRVIGDYISKGAQNAVDSTISQSSQMVIDRYNAPASFAVGYGVSDEEKNQAELDYNMARESIMKGNVAYTGNTYVIQVNVDGEQIRSETVKESDFVRGGMSYIAGGN